MQTGKKNDVQKFMFLPFLHTLSSLTLCNLVIADFPVIETFQPFAAVLTMWLRKRLARTAGLVRSGAFFAERILTWRVFLAHWAFSLNRGTIAILTGNNTTGVVIGSFLLYLTLLLAEKDPLLNMTMQLAAKGQRLPATTGSSTAFQHYNNSR